MSLRVGLGASQADLDVQGEIDFDFFDEDATISSNKTMPESPTCHVPSDSQHSKDILEKKNSDNPPINGVSNRRDHDEKSLSVSNAPGSSNALNTKNPIITISCDNGTGAIQKTTIEAVIPTPFTYKENKCGKFSPQFSSNNKVINSPRLKSKIFENEKEFSDDSLSSMSSSESDLSSIASDGTDSMTDVTPIRSPFQCRTPVPDSKLSSRERNGNVVKKEGVKFRREECSSNCDSVDLNELLKAVKRLEIEKSAKERSHSSASSQHGAGFRKNLSFTNDQVRRIDNENHRLLKNICAQHNRPKPKPGSTAVNPPSSAINRQRQQRQIELDNLALLKRLESAKPSKYLSRFHLLRDYDCRSTISSRSSSRASQQLLCPSQSSSCRSSAQSSGRSSNLSLKSANSLSSRSHMSANCINKPKRSLLTAAKN